MEKIKIYSNPAAGGASVQSDDGDAISLPEVVVIGSYPRGSWWDSWGDSWGSFSDPWDYPPSSMESSTSDDSHYNDGGGGSNTGNKHHYGGGPSSVSGSGSKGVSDVISPSDFKGFRNDDPQGCFRRCEEMLKKANCSLSGGEIAMTKSNSLGRATKSTTSFSEGCSYIDAQLAMGHPVVVSVDYKNGTTMGKSRQDQAGDHFVIIVGGGKSVGYHYYDPATASLERGTNSSNKFTMQKGLLKSTTSCTGKPHEYTLTGVRKNK